MMCETTAFAVILQAAEETSRCAKYSSIMITIFVAADTGLQVSSLS